MSIVFSLIFFRSDGVVGMDEGVTCHRYEPFKYFQGLRIVSCLNVIVIHVMSPTLGRKEEDVHPNTTSMSLKSNKNSAL